MAQLTLICVLLSVIMIAAADECPVVDLKAFTQSFITGMTTILENIDVNDPAGVQIIRDNLKKAAMWDIQLIDHKKEPVCGIEAAVDFFIRLKNAAGSAGALSSIVQEAYSMGDFGHATVGGLSSANGKVGRAMLLFRRSDGHWKVSRLLVNYGPAL